MKDSAELSQKAEDIFDGETMRGLLLTAYGFSVLGDRGATAALACFIIAAVLALGAILSLAVGMRSDRRVAEPIDRSVRVPTTSTGDISR